LDAAPKSKNWKGLLAGVVVPLVWPNMEEAPLFSFSDSESLSLVILESKLPLGAVSCFWVSSDSVSDSPNARCVGVAGSAEPTVSCCSASSSSDSSWLLDDAPDRWPKMLGDDVCEAEASKTD